ncbi:hypothetical protein AAHB37_04300 [Glutamicibacter halophytocola]|uniref:hypothetical protein n=1 Tax=Glutamicibacter halophytocola TaxID=1933880 RepID=UPI00321B7CF3
MLLGFPEAFNPAVGLVGWDILPAGPWALVAALLVGAPVIFMAVVGTLSSAFSVNAVMRRNSRRLLWGAVIAVAAGWAVGFVPVTMDSHTAVTAYTGPFVSFAVFALIAAAANALAALRHEDKPRAVRAGAPRLALALTAALSVVAVLASGSVLLATQLNPAAASESMAKLVNTQQVGSSQPRTLPATASGCGPFGIPGAHPGAQSAVFRRNR